MLLLIIVFPFSSTKSFWKWIDFLFHKTLGSEVLKTQTKSGFVYLGNDKDWQEIVFHYCKKRWKFSQVFPFTHLNNFFGQSTIIFFRDLCTIWCFIKNRWIVIDIANMYNNGRKILFTIISRLNFKFILLVTPKKRKNMIKLVTVTYFSNKAR